MRAQEAPAAEVVKTSVTVTAQRGASEETSTSLALVYAKRAPEQPGGMDKVLAGTPGVVPQSTTPGQASPTLRGLTGYQTLLMLDGVRLNTSIFRSGPNQYSAFVDGTQVEQVEVLMGPASAAYGSDAMGGAVHFVTRSVEEGQRRFAVGTGAASGDLSGAVDSSFGWDTAKFSVLGSGFLRRHNDVRAGGGLDSHNVYTRYAGYTLEQARARMGERMPETAYTQAGWQVKGAWKRGAEERLTAFAERGAQYGVRGYRELMGGQGRLQALYEPQTLELGYLRYERPSAGPLERVSVTGSWNRQADHSRRQGANYADAVIVDRNGVTVYGLSAQAGRRLGTKALVLGGVDAQRERVRSYRSVAPAQFPDGALYTAAAPFVQVSAQPWSRVRVQGGLRYNRNRFELPEAQRVPLLGPEQRFTALVGNVSGAVRVVKALEVIGTYSQGFRAPNVSDLGATGLTTQGFEIPAEVAAGAGGLLALDATEGALPRGGQRLQALGAERLANYEAGLRYRAAHWVARVQGYSAVLDNPIVRRTVLFGAGAVPASLNGIGVSALPQTAAQRAAGVVTVATVYDGRAVKTGTNDGGLRYQGISAEAEWRPGGSWMVSGSYSYMNGREILPNRTPRRLPPQDGAVRVVWRPKGRFSVQSMWIVNGRQERLSTGDVDDERMGASRSRRDIQAFFRTPIGLSTAIEGTVGQVMERLLPLNQVVNGVLVAAETTKVPMVTAVESWWRVDASVAYEVGKAWRISAGVENAGDRHYRVSGSGADGLGRSVFMRSEYRF